MQNAAGRRFAASMKPPDVMSERHLVSIISPPA